MLPRSFVLESGSLQSLPSSPRCPTNGCFGSLLSGLESAADPEHVPIRMAKVHLADVPRISVGGNVTSSPAATHSLCISSRRPPRPASRPPCRPLRLRLAETRWCSRRGRGLLAPPRKERCKFPCPIQPRQMSEAFSPTISSIPTSQTRRTCWLGRTRSISESDLWLP
jgi:hypothetical protein